MLIFNEMFEILNNTFSQFLSGLLLNYLFWFYFNLNKAGSKTFRVYNHLFLPNK